MEGVVGVTRRKPSDFPSPTRLCNVSSDTVVVCIYQLNHIILARLYYDEGLYRNS